MCQEISVKLKKKCLKQLGETTAAQFLQSINVLLASSDELISCKEKKFLNFNHQQTHIGK